MDALRDYRIPRDLRNAVFENPLQAKTPMLIRCIRFIARKEKGCLYSLCAAAGITRWELNILERGKNLKDPSTCEVDDIGWYLSAVMMRAGATLDEIFGTYFPKRDMQRHLRWHKACLPRLRQEIEEVNNAVADCELIADKALTEKLSFKQAIKAVESEINTSREVLVKMWQTKFEYANYFALVRNKEHCSLKYGTGRLLKWKSELSEHVKAHCKECGNYIAVNAYDALSKSAPKRCVECNQKRMQSVKHDYFVIDIISGYRYYNRQIAFDKLDAESDGWNMRTFNRHLNQYKAVKVHGRFLWLAKREQYSMPSKVRQRFKELGLPDDFKFKTSILGSVARKKLDRLQAKYAKRNKLKTKLRREAERQEAMITKEKIDDYRNRMHIRGEQIKQELIETDRLEELM